MDQGRKGKYGDDQNVQLAYRQMMLEKLERLVVMRQIQMSELIMTFEYKIKES